MARKSNLELEMTVQRAGLKRLMQDRVFRRFILTVLDDAAIDQTTFRQGSPHDTSFLEGRRALGLTILDMLRAAEPAVRASLEAEREILRLSISTPPGDDHVQFPDED